MRQLFVTLLAGAVLAGSATAQAQQLAYTPGAGCCGVSEGYGGASATTWTAQINSAFGGAAHVTQVADLSVDLASYSALLVNLRDFSSAFSPAESSNLAAFLATGKRVFIFGENYLWTDWDASIVSQFGATSTPGCLVAPSATAVTNALTTGVSTVQTLCASTMTGGTSLFADGFAMLFGPSDNALVLDDVNICDNGGLTAADNANFCSNIAGWLATSGEVSATPEPATFVLVGTGLFGVAGFARRRRRA